jgi:flotillin
MTLLQYILIGLAVLAIAAPFLIAWMWRVVVPTNMVHIVNVAKSQKVYGRNYPAGNAYFRFPEWFPFVGVSVTQFETSNFQIKLENKEVNAFNNVPILISTQSVFVLKDAKIVAEKVASDKVMKDSLTDIVISSLRTVCNKYTIEELLAKRKEISSDFSEEVNKNTNEWGLVAVNELHITSIEDGSNSRAIADIREKEKSRINCESRLVQAAREREAKMAEIEAQRQVDLAEQEALQQVATRTAEKEKAIGIAQELTKQEIAEQIRITTERDMEVKAVQDNKAAEIAKTVAETNAKAAKAVEITNAEAEKEKQALEADAQLIFDQKQAEGIKAKEFANAESIAKVGAAKATAEKEMQLASVTAQVTLAEKVGDNKAYQDYLVRKDQVVANKEVGIAQAAALEKANINIVGGSGSNAGMMLASALNGFGSTELGQKVINTVTKSSGE